MRTEQSRGGRGGGRYRTVRPGICKYCFVKIGCYFSYRFVPFDRSKRYTTMFISSLQTQREGEVAEEG